MSKSGEPYARKKKGYWRKYRRQRRFRYQRAIFNLNRLLKDRPDPYKMHPPGTRGRTPAPPKTILLCHLFRNLFQLSYLDTQSFLLWIAGHAGMSWVPGSSTIQDHAKDIPEAYLESMLLDFIQFLDADGVNLIVDASGLSTQAYGRWQSVRTAPAKKKRKFVKLHLMIDRDSKLVTMGIASKGSKGDGPFGRRLIKRVRAPLRRAGMKVKCVLGDGGYAARETATLIETLDARPVLRTRSDANARSIGHPAWARMVFDQRQDPDAHQARYCYRVVIEGVIGAIKATFGRTLRSKKRHNQNIEVLCRLILWNSMKA